MVFGVRPSVSWFPKDGQSACRHCGSFAAGIARYAGGFSDAISDGKWDGYLAIEELDDILVTVPVGSGRYLTAIPNWGNAVGWNEAIRVLSERASFCGELGSSGND